MKKNCKIVASWALFLLGFTALVVLCGGVIDGILSVCSSVLLGVIGMWGVPACIALLIVCVLLFFALNPIEGESEE